jgi:hypothetical protein
MIIIWQQTTEKVWDIVLSRGLGVRQVLFARWD